MSYVLGIDLGTSSLKGILVNERGEIIKTASSDYPLIHPASGYSEQDPYEWIKACENVLDTLKKEVKDFADELSGISFSGQMHSLVVLNEEKQVLRNAILWNDVRTTKQCEQIMENFGNEILQITKNVALEGFTLPKILWIQENEPDIWEKVRHIMLPKDYIGFWMTRNIHMDYSDAAGTLLLDVKEKKWSNLILGKYQINKDYLPKLTDSIGFTGLLNDEIKNKYGFKQEVKIFAGGADNACAAVGSGILAEGVGMASIGTSGVFLAYEDSSSKDYRGKLHLFNHAEPNGYYSMGVTLGAGHSLSWFKDVFMKGTSYNDLLDGIENIRPGSEGLIFTPYISGERTPYADSKIRGSFIGMSDQHNNKHFTRSVLEGITFSLKDSQVLMEKITNRKFKKIISVGGGAKNAEWLQMQADIFNVEVTTLESEQGPGLGASMLAAVGLGWFDNLTECGEVFVNYKVTIEPIEDNVKIYENVYQQYAQVYNATKNISHSLSEMTKH